MPQQQSGANRSDRETLATLAREHWGHDEYGLTRVRAFVKWHLGQLTWAQALRDSRIQLDGPSWLVKAFPTWNGRSMFAHINPVAGAALAI